jgi:hypothetical protein
VPRAFFHIAQAERSFITKQAEGGRGEARSVLFLRGKPDLLRRSGLFSRVPV